MRCACKLLVAMTALVLAAGCGSGSSNGSSASGGAAGSPSSGPPVHITDLLAVVSPNNVLAYDVSWKTSRDADTELDVSCDTLTPWTISDPGASVTHHVFLMGLSTGVTCTLTATGKAPDRGTGSAKTTIDVSPLPGYLPPIAVTVPAKPGTLAPGWTLLNLSNEQTGTPYIAALIDSKARFRWYYQYPSDVAGEDTPVSAYENGVLIGGRAIPLSYVTWQSQLAWSDDSGEYFHHEARPAETANEFYTLSATKCSNRTYASDDVVEWDSIKKADVWTWNPCDHYTPPQDVPDCMHLNTVSLFPDQKFLLVSSRNQNSVLRINRATGALVWAMGYHGEVEDGFHGDFTMTDADRFLHQHDATVLPNGHILMFDNGRSGVRTYSRGLELAYTYNPSGRSEAHVVWQFRHTPDIFAPVWGSAQRLSNGNTLVCFGEHDAGEHSTIVEVSSASKPLLELRTPGNWGVYRAERIARQYGTVLP